MTKEILLMAVVVIEAVSFAALLLWWLKLKKVQRNAADKIQEAIEDIAEAETVLKEWYDGITRIVVASSILETDTLKHKKASAIKKEVVARIARTVSYKVMKAAEVKEIVKDGVVTGYKVDIEVRNWTKK